MKPRPHHTPLPPGDKKRGDSNQSSRRLFSFSLLQSSTVQPLNTKSGIGGEKRGGGGVAGGGGWCGKPSQKKKKKTLVASENMFRCLFTCQNIFFLVFFCLFLQYLTCALLVAYLGSPVLPFFQYIHQASKKKKRKKKVY